MTQENAAVAVGPAGVVVVGGPDRRAFLQAMLSQDVDRLEVGAVADFLFLDAKGGPRAAGWLAVREHDILLVVPAEIAEPFAETLASSTFLMQAAPAALQGWSQACARGPAAVPADAVAQAPREPDRCAVVDEVLIARRQDGSVVWIGPAAAVGDAIARTDLAQVEPHELERWRIAAGVPAWGSEIVAGHRTQELGLLPTHVHLDKGCYPGQESIAKTYNLGRPRRALCVVDFDGPVTAGTPLESDRRGGTVTSAAATEAGAVALCLLAVDRDGQPPQVVEAPGAAGVVRQRVGAGRSIPGAVP